MDLGALEVILMRSYSPQIGKESQEEMDNRVLTRLGFWFNIDYLLWANIKHNWSSFRANVSCSKIYSLCIKGMAQITAKNPSHRPPRAGFWPQPTNGYRFLIGGQTPFKFENMWLKQPSFRQSIQFWWTEALTNGWENKESHRNSESLNINWRTGTKMSLAAYSSKKNPF